VSISPDIAIPEHLNLQAAQPSLEQDTRSNNPPWSLLTAVLTWIASVVLLFLPQVFAIPYVAVHYRNTQPTTEILLADKTLVLILIAGVLPVHLLTLAIVWAITTRFGKLSLVETLGLTWNGKFRIGRSIGLAIILYGAALLLTLAFGGQGTALDRLVESSRAAALMIAFLAVVTAPIVEESIYRGILYPALERVSGAPVAVILVTVLFAVPHVPQYWPNFAVIISITLLSVALTVLRARTGRLLPCVAVHLVFNGIQSVIIVAEPYVRHPRPSGFITQLLNCLH